MRALGLVGLDKLGRFLRGAGLARHPSWMEFDLEDGIHAQFEWKARVTIESGAGGALLWKNAAGGSWALEARDDGEIYSTKDCPYGELKLGILLDEAERFSVLLFHCSLAPVTALGSRWNRHYPRTRSPA